MKFSTFTFALLSSLTCLSFSVASSQTLAPASPNGKIAFASHRTGNPEIFTMNPDGSNQTNITNHPSSDSVPVWSPDGRRIVFSSNRTGNFDFRTYIMNAYGSNQTLFSIGPFDDQLPSWSDDGTKVVYTSGADLVVMNADGTNQSRLRTTSITFVTAPSFSPDNSRITFSCRRNTGSPPILNHEVCVINADGTNERYLTETLNDEFPISFSPDGTKILLRDGRARTVDVMNSDGSNRVVLVTEGDSGDWSPDGSKIVYDQFNGNTYEIWVINADGTNKTRLTNNTSDLSPAWQRVRPTAFDFDGDGRADQAVFRPSDTFWYQLRSQAGFTASQFGISTDKIVPADFDGDGKTDIAVFRNGTWYIQRSQLGFTGVSFGDANDIPVPADYDGDSKADVAVFRPSNGFWYVLKSTDNSFVAQQFGQPGDKPVVGDYDGDGRADFAVFRPESGVWFTLQSTLGFRANYLGVATDRVVHGDYDGDGRTDFAVWRPSDGKWHLLQSQNGLLIAQFGISTDEPVPGDYDGDGKFDIAVYRNGIWYIQQTSSGFRAAQFGSSGDKLIPAAYNPAAN